MAVKEEAKKNLNTAIEYYKNNDIERAKKYFTKAIDGYSKVIESGVHDKVIYKNRGIAYMGLEDYPKAIEDFTKVIELDENNKDTYDGRGRAYMCIKNYPKAIEDFTKVIELGVNNKDVYGSRGRAYACIGDYTRAVEDLTRAIELGADNKDVYSSRGIAYVYTKEYTKAIEDLTKAIELGANDKVIYDSRGIAYRCIENYARAIEDFTKAIELDENNKEAYENRGHVYACIENYTKAIEDFSKVIGLDENNKNAYGNCGLAYLRLGDYTKAIEDLTKVIELDKNNKDAYASRGHGYIGVEEYIKAIKDLTKAIELDKNNQFAYIERGFAYIRVGGYTKAIGDFTTAIELGANNKDIYIIRGIAYIGKKDYTEAINDFKEVIKLNKSGNEKENTTGGDDHISNKISLTDNILNLIFHLSKSNESKVLSDDETLNLIELVCSCYDLMEEIKIEPSKLNGEKIVHYTKASTVQHLLKKDHSAQLRLNNAVYMNDPEEGQILKKVLCQLDKNKELESLLKDEDVKNYTYLTCFSLHNERNELPMWVHYGDGGKGVGLVFSNSFFDKTDLYSVIYIDIKNPDIKNLNQNVQKKITAILNLLQEDGIRNNTRKEFKVYVNIILNYVSYLFKDKAYEYENEVRILNYKDYNSQDIKTAVYESGIPRLFIEYDKCISDENCVEVIAGPKANYTEIAAYAKYVGIQKVSQSEIKYR